MRKPISARRRYEVLRRDDYTCQCCGGVAPNVTLHVDHIEPVSKGGTDDLENLRAVCVTCNLGKSDLDMPKAEQPPVPVEPNKHPLIGWAFLSYRMEDGKEVVSEQGEIRAVMPSNCAVGELVLVDYFDWMAGQYTYSQCVPIAFFSKPWGSEKFYKLFQTAEERNNYYEWKHGRS